MRSALALLQRIARRPRTGPPLVGLAALVALVIVLRLVFAGRPAPAGVLAFGVVIGLLYGLLACGLILVYRATRIINFAQAEIGGAAAIVAVLLIKQHDVPYLVALPLALVVGGMCGWLVELLVVRRFAKAPRLVLSVATIGLSLVFGAIQLLLPILFGVTSDLGIDARPIDTPLSGFELRIEPLVFDANSLLVVLAAAGVLVALTAFFKFTEIGFAVRASAENAERALLLGIPVNRVSGVVWLIAGALSALGLFLRVPLTGLPVGTSVGPFVLLYALAAAVIARMERFSTALLAAVGLGITEQAIYFSTRDVLVPVAVTLPVLLVAMLLQSKDRSRGQDTGVSTWSLAKDHRLAPPELRGLPEVTAGRLAFVATVVAAALALPHVLGPSQQNLSAVIVIYGIVAISLVILTGWSGQISLGHWGFAGLGAAVAGGVSVHLGGDFFVALLLAGLLGAIAAVVIGLPALRIQGLYLAVTTLSFALMVQAFVLNPKYFSWLLPGSDRIQRPVIFERFDTSGSVPFYYLTLVFLVLALLSARALRYSRAGRLLIAVRDNQRGAQSYGISVRAARIWAFAISGFWAALAGALFAYHQQSVDNAAFSPELSLTLLMIVVIGGSTSLPGAILGTVYFGVVKYSALSPQLQLLSSGLGALLLLMFLPGGLTQLFYGGRDAVLRRIAMRRNLVVPSLLADKRVDAPPEAQGVQIPQAGGRSLSSIRRPGTSPATDAEPCPHCGSGQGQASVEQRVAVDA